ncbi:hypothetical protein BHM03_00042541 [Ensete ventricosum]|nr:hypothetical protein BHM03_00042541 [Ensete ventricosum]
MSFYSGCCGLFVPDDLTAFMTHHAVAPLAMPAVLVVRRAPAGRGCRPYLCQVGCTAPGVLRTSGRSVTLVWPRQISNDVERGAARVDPTEHELGNMAQEARSDRAALRRKSGDLAERVRSGANPEIWPGGRTQAQIRRFDREGELGRKSGDLAERVNSGANPEIWPRGRTRAQIRRFGREGELGRKSGDLAERANSGATPEILPRM